MKKVLIAIIATAVCASAFSQQRNARNQQDNTYKTRENIYGIDITAGMPAAYAVNTLTYNDGTKANLSWAEINAQLKVATYDFFDDKNHFGIYASAGLDFGYMLSGSIAVDRQTTDVPGNMFGVAGEFMFGPAFGVDWSVHRFQLGVALHSAVAYYVNNLQYDYVNDDRRVSSRTLTYATLGFALTPQLRFETDSRISFVSGFDVVVDFTINTAYIEKGTGTRLAKISTTPSSSVRIGVTPYVGVGINLGKKAYNKPRSRN